MDWIDNILGPLNLIDKARGLYYAIKWRDLGVLVTIPRLDKDGQTGFLDARKTLREYGIRTYWYSHDAKNIYMRVERRQARWAGIILLSCGVDANLQGMTKEIRAYVASKPPGWRPTSWASKKKKNKIWKMIKGISEWI